MSEKIKTIDVKDIARILNQPEPTEATLRFELGDPEHLVAVALTRQNKGFNNFSIELVQTVIPYLTDRYQGSAIIVAHKGSIDMLDLEGRSIMGLFADGKTRPKLLRDTNQLKAKPAKSTAEAEE